MSNTPEWLSKLAIETLYKRVIEAEGLLADIFNHPDDEAGLTLEQKARLHAIFRDCNTCSGDGIIDSGAKTSWGEWIGKPCPECSARTQYDRVMSDVVKIGDINSIQAALDLWRKMMNSCPECKSEMKSVVLTIPGGGLCNSDWHYQHPDRCCDNENRGFEGGCLSCGDPCL